MQETIIYMIQWIRQNPEERACHKKVTFLAGFQHKMQVMVEMLIVYSRRVAHSLNIYRNDDDFNT